MRRIPIIAATAALALLLVALFATPSPAANAAPVSAGSHLHIIDLGTLGSPQDSSQATGINNRGDVIGWSDIQSCFCSHAFLWRHGKMTDLAPLTAANDINDDGVIAGAGGTASGYRAFRWAHGKALNLGTLGGDFSQALGINDRGTVVGAGQVPSVGYRGFVWRNGVMTPLSVLPAGNSSIAYDINNQGVIVGSSGIDPNNSFYHAVLWR